MFYDPKIERFDYAHLRYNLARHITNLGITENNSELIIDKVVEEFEDSIDAFIRDFSSSLSYKHRQEIETLKKENEELKNKNIRLIKLIDILLKQLEDKDN